MARTQVSAAVQTMEVRVLHQMVAELSKMGEAACLFLGAMLGSQCTGFAMFLLNALITLFQKALTLGQA